MTRAKHTLAARSAMVVTNLNPKIKKNQKEKGSANEKNANLARVVQLVMEKRKNPQERVKMSQTTSTKNLHLER